MPKFQVLLPQLWDKSRTYHRIFFFVLCLFLVSDCSSWARETSEKRVGKFLGHCVLHASWIFRSDTQEEVVSNCFSKVWLSTVLTPHPEKIEPLLQRQKSSSSISEGYSGVFSVLIDWTRFSGEVWGFFVHLFYKTIFPVLGNSSDFEHI